MSENQQERSVWPWLVMLVLTVVAVALAWPIVKDQKSRSDQARSISNLREIGLAMYEFETAYGRFPDGVSAPMVAAKSKLRLDLSGHSANAYFRQLIAAEVVHSEVAFFALTRFSQKPDNRFDTNDNALAPGEVGVGYLMNGTTALAKEGHFSRTLACAPLAFDGKVVSERSFDNAIYGGKGAVLRIDMGVQMVPIRRSDGQLLVGGGKTLLEADPDTVWGEKVTPTIVPPLPKR